MNEWERRWAKRNQYFPMKPAIKHPEIALEKLSQEDRRKVLMLMECAEQLYITVADVMPQIGGICLQDYGALNRGLLLGEKLFGKPQRKSR